jgi:integrase
MTGAVTSKCTRGHTRAAKRCGSRCLRWYFILSLGTGPDGKRRRQWSGGYPTRKAAEAALREELHRRDQGILLEGGGQTVTQIAERWLTHVATLLDESTVAEYRRHLRLHVLPALGGRQLKTLSPLDLTDLYAQLLRGGRRDGKPGGLSPRTVQHVHRTVHRMLRQAVRWQLVGRNVAAGLELPPVDSPRMVTLTREQAARLLDAADASRAGWWHPLILLAVATGARRGELLGLRWSDVDLDTGTLRVRQQARLTSAAGARIRFKTPKTAAGARQIGLGPATIAELRRCRAEQAGRRLAYGGAYHADDDLIVCLADGAPVRPDYVSTAFRQLANRAGLPAEIHLHTLRHSAASFLAAAGVPASDIAAQLGHADGGALALRVYVHPLEENKRRAAAYLDQVVGGRR